MNDAYEFELTLANGHGAIARVLLAFSRRRVTITRLMLEAGPRDARIRLSAECRDAATALDIRRQLARMVEVVSVGSGVALPAARHLAAGG